MSYKYAVIKDGTNRYVLQKQGDMNCDVIAFLSPDLFDGTDEGLWQDAVRSASYPGAMGMYLMPDCHKGYVLPVGGVLITEDTICQAGSGYDISCGIVQMKVDGLTAADVADWDKRVEWVREVEKRVGAGVGSGGLLKAPKSSQVEEILRHGAAALGVSADMCERQFIEIAENVDLTAIARARNLAGGQLGSIGGGNHYCEMQVDRDDGSVWVMVHCGSRGFGWQAANHFFHEGAKLRGLPSNQRETSWLRRDEALGEEYWQWHNAAANYAVANRWTIVGGIQQALEAVFNTRATPYYEISHNLVQEETIVLPDGTTKKGFVHRKGSTRAFPAGHPDLVGTKWSETGHPCLIPGSMLDGAAILFPLGGNEDGVLTGAYKSGCSVNHGSGRIMGRAEAKRQLGDLHDDIDDEMRTITRSFETALGPVQIKGIVGNCERTPLDECGHVYKDLDEVLSVLETEGIAKIHRRLWPVANIKGA